MVRVYVLSVRYTDRKRIIVVCDMSEEDDFELLHLEDGSSPVLDDESGDESLQGNSGDEEDLDFEPDVKELRLSKQNSTSTGSSDPPVGRRMSMESTYTDDSYMTRDSFYEEQAANKVYDRISCDAKSIENIPLSYVSRIALFRDRKYAVSFVVMFIVVLVIGVKTPEVSWKSRYILSLVVSLLISGGVNALLVSAYYRLFRVDTWTPFSAKYLYVVQPMEALFLLLVSLAIWIKGWSIVVGFVPIIIAFYDSSHISRSGENLQFASVVLEMASEIILLDAETGPVLRKTWFCFMFHSAWLIGWSWIFVDVAQGSGHVSNLMILFLFFILFWTTQVARSFVSSYITGTVCHRLLTSRDEGSGTKVPSQVVETELFKRSMNICFGSVCAGALMIGPISLLWGAVELVLSVLCKRDNAGASDFDGTATDHEPRTRRASSHGRAEQSLRKAQTKISSRLINRANRYAWARVALRGTPFIRASEETWSKMLRKGVDGVVKRDVAEHVLRCWSWIFGSVTALFSLLLLPRTVHEESEIIFLFFIAAYCLGAANSALLMEPLRATVGAIFVAFAEKEDCFAEDYPIVHHRFERICEMELFSN
mmetsp:Transcript_1997/g.3519  ORF Transcript_1997/g.3519 Transcript_1997/m.3519 type:complete len:596 (+) Transcript_1997:2351-4138(+)